MSVEVKMDLSGIDIAKLEVRKAMERGIKEVTYDLEQKSTDEAPIHYGDLRDSAQSSFETTMSHYESSVSYNTIYAVRQHEHPEYNHPKGGKGKYLEDPFKHNIDKYLNHIKNMIKGVLK